MNTCAWQERVEAHFDGETLHAAGVEAHLAHCPDCTAHLAALGAMRGGVAAVRLAPEIADAQFRVFMDGIREGLDARPAPWRGLWALASAAAACLVIALSAFFVLSGGPAPVAASEVESASTELEGATIDVYDSADGVMTLKVNISKDDIL